MQMVIRLFVYFLITCVALVLFAPKKELYYLAEKELTRQHIVLAGERIHETAFGLKLEDLGIQLDGSEIAEIKQVDLWTLLFYSRAIFAGLKPAPGMERLLPVTIKHGEASHSLLDPTRIHLRLEGSFGAAVGTIDLSPPLRLHLEFLHVEKLGALRSYLNRGKRKWIYETRFYIPLLFGLAASGSCHSGRNQTLLGPGRSALSSHQWYRTSSQSHP
jgi:hypothetical protein